TSPRFPALFPVRTSFGRPYRDCRANLRRARGLRTSARTDPDPHARTTPRALTRTRAGPHADTASRHDDLDGCPADAGRLVLPGGRRPVWPAAERGAAGDALRSRRGGG